MMKWCDLWRPRDSSSSSSFSAPDHEPLSLTSFDIVTLSFKDFFEIHYSLFKSRQHSINKIDRRLYLSPASKNEARGTIWRLTELKFFISFTVIRQMAKN